MQFPKFISPSKAATRGRYVRGSSSDFKEQYLSYSKANYLSNQPKRTGFQVSSGWCRNGFEKPLRDPSSLERIERKQEIQETPEETNQNPQVLQRKPAVPKQSERTRSSYRTFRNQGEASESASKLLPNVADKRKTCSNWFSSGSKVGENQTLQKIQKQAVISNMSNVIKPSDLGAMKRQNPTQIESLASFTQSASGMPKPPEFSSKTKTTVKIQRADSLQESRILERKFKMAPFDIASDTSNGEQPLRKPGASVVEPAGTLAKTTSIPAKLNESTSKEPQVPAKSGAISSSLFIQRRKKASVDSSDFIKAHLSKRKRIGIDSSDDGLSEKAKQPIGIASSEFKLDTQISERAKKMNVFTPHTHKVQKIKKITGLPSGMSLSSGSPKQLSESTADAVKFLNNDLKNMDYSLKKIDTFTPQKEQVKGIELFSEDSQSQLSSEADFSIEASSDISSTSAHFRIRMMRKSSFSKPLVPNKAKEREQAKQERLAKLASLLDGLDIDLEVIEEMQEDESQDGSSSEGENDGEEEGDQPKPAKANRVRNDDLLQEDLANKIRKKKPPRGKNTYMFGDNREGKCGIASPEAMVKVPTPLSGLFKKISCGFHHTLALDSNNLLYGWGRNSFGQIGQGEEISIEGESIQFPTLIKGPLHCVVISEVACGYQHSMALTPNGFLFAWGLNLYGQLGTSDFRDRNEPALVKALTTHKVTNFSAGHMHSGAITDQGKMFLWGHNPDCRLFKKLDYYKKSGKTVNYCRPQLVEGANNAQFYEVSCGTSHTLALDHLGYVYAAGSPQNGQLGVPPSKFLPDMCEQPFVTIPGFCMSFPAQAISAGDGFSLVLDSRGRVYSCGKGDFGRLGNGGVHSEWTMHEIKFFKQKRIRIQKIYAGGRHSLAVSEDTSQKIPRLFGWGFGFYHQLGQGKKEDALEPVEIDMKGFPIEEASCGYFMSATIIDDLLQFH